MRYDAVIVGAGPAGAATAMRLARAGAGVCIVERAQFPRTKACGEYLSPGTVRMIHALGVGPAVKPDAALLRGIRLFGSGVSAEFPFSSPAWSLPRARLDDALLDAARGAGAARVLGRAEHFSRNGSGLRVYVQTATGDMRIDGAVVIGADGAQSLVARQFGLSGNTTGKRRFAVGGHYSGLRGLDACLEMFVDGSSYFAINPFDETNANVMLIVEEAQLRAARDDVDGFVRERARALTGGRIQFDRARLEGKRIAIGPLASRARALSAEHVLLAGDAAEFLDPFTGQGVSLALRSAEFAAQAVISALSGQVTQIQAWRKYETRLRAELERRKRLSALVSMLVRVPLVAKSAAAIAQRRPRVFMPLLDAVTGAA